MTTPPTPAGWYPDPGQSGGRRYWDGARWTEHLTPAQPPPSYAAPAPPADQPKSPPEPAEPAATERVGAHRAPEPSEPEPEPEPVPITEQPTTQVPLRDWTVEPTPEPTTDPTPLPITEQPTTQVPLREPWPYADATTPTPAEPPVVEPPAGTEPPAPVDNRNLVMWFGGAVAALLLALVLVAIYAFVINKDDTVQISAPTTTESSATPTDDETTTSEEATATESPTPPPAAGAVDGPLEFTVTGVESAPTVTDPTNEFLTKDAQGEFVVVRLTVRNTSPDPATFLGTFQKLKAAGTVYSADDQASFYVGGGLAEIPPGGQVDVGVAYDVPPGTVPESIELHADPTSPGVELPLA